MRFAAGLVAVLALAGCGSSNHRAAAPPIRAVNATPDRQLRVELELFLQSAPASAHVRSGFDVWDSAGHVKPTAAQLAHLQAEIAARRAAEQPGRGSQPRVVARLPLAGGGEASFVAWRNRRGALCTFTQVTDASGSGGGTPGGRCVSTAAHLSSPCAAICLGSFGEGDPVRFVLSGTVAAGADALAVTTVGGRTATYPLTGPRLGTRRVFLLDLGATEWRRLTLYRNGSIVGRTSLPPTLLP